MAETWGFSRATSQRMDCLVIGTASQTRLKPLRAVRRQLTRKKNKESMPLFWLTWISLLLVEQKKAAALYTQAGDYQKTARFYYKKAEDTYYQVTR